MQSEKQESVNRFFPSDKEQTSGFERETFKKA